MIAQLSTRQYAAQVLPIFGGMIGVSTVAAYMTRYMTGGIYLLSIIVTFGMILTVRWWRESAAAIPMCMALALAMGGMIGPTVHLYRLDIVEEALGTTAATFGAMAFIGYTTKRDLTGMGMFLHTALWGLVIAWIINMFLHGPMIALILSVFGVVIFSGFAAYDMQRIRQGAYGPIDGAIALYLDFINLFLNILQLLGAFSNSRD